MIPKRFETQTMAQARVSRGALRLVTAGLVISLTALAPLRPSRPVTDLKRLAQLYESGRYFELRDALAPLRDQASVDLEFFRGAVDQVFNRLDPAASKLRRFLDATRNGPVRMLDKEAGILLAEALSRLGRYRDAAAEFRRVLARCAAVLDDGERTRFENQADFWAGLAGVPPQTVEVLSATEIPLRDRNFPIRIGGRELRVGYDTGANLSVLYRSAAEELGLPVAGPEIQAQTVTGRWVRGRTMVVPELRLGSVVIRNALFLVLDDDLFPSSKTKYGLARRGLIGAPILCGLREFSETADGRLVVPASPRRRTVENMFLSGLMPVVEVLHRGSRLALCLDTGATTTVLFPPFYRQYRGEIDSRSFARDVTIDGVGSSRTVPVRRLDEFAFRAGGRRLALRRVLVQTREIMPDTRFFHGTLGVDLLTQCSRMTLNFGSMSFLLE